MVGGLINRAAIDCFCSANVGRTKVSVSARGSVANVNIKSAIVCVGPAAATCPS